MYDNRHAPFCSTECEVAWYKNNQDVMKDMGLKNIKQVREYYMKEGYNDCPHCGKRTAFTPVVFFIMKPNATEDYLYNYARVVDVHKGYKIVGLEDTGNLDYHLNYQMMRVASGLDLAGRETFDTINAAREMIDYNR